MEQSYENIFLAYSFLKNKCKNNYYGNVRSLLIPQEIIKIFEDFGLIIVENNRYLFLDLPEKSANYPDLFFYFTHQKKLSKILDPSLKTRFFIHYILFKIQVYLTPEKLVNIIRREIEGTQYQNIFQTMNVTEQDIYQAHSILLEAGLIKKQFCLTNQYYNDEGKIIIIKNMWYFSKPNESEIQVDYIQKILFYRLIDLL